MASPRALADSPARPAFRAIHDGVASRAALVLGAVLALGSSGCGENSATIAITDVRERSATAPAPRLGMSDEDRFGLAPEWRYDIPAGWQRVADPPKAPGRVATLRVAASADAECTLSALEGDGGGFVENVNRWRRQMGLEPVRAEALRSLATTPFLGEKVPWVELSGAYSRADGAPIADALLLGVVATLPMATIFLKFVGPASVVAAERARFFEFAASVRSKTLESLSSSSSTHARPGGASTTSGVDEIPKASDGAGTPAPPRPLNPPPAGPSVAPPSTESSKTTGEAGGLRWTVPAGWTPGPGNSFRLASFTVDGAPAATVSLSKAGGGVLENLNRWRGQFGLEGVTDDDAKRLPRVPMLGGEGVLVDLNGHLKDPMRRVDEPDGMLLGAIATQGDQQVFVKLTGPAAAVRAQRAAFEAFCRSLEASAAKGAGR